MVPDMQTSRPLTLRFGYEPKPGGGGMFYAWVDGEEEDSASGTDLDWCESHAERLVEFADWLQDQVIPESHAAWGEACQQELKRAPVSGTEKCSVGVGLRRRFA